MPVLITNDPIGNFGGIQRYVARLAIALSAKTFPVIVIEPRNDNRKNWSPVRIANYSTGGRLQTIFNALVVLVQEIRKLPKEPVIASTWFPCGLLVALIPDVFRGKFAVLAHGLEIEPSRGGIRRRIMRWTFARADVVIADSRCTNQLLDDAGVRAHIVVVSCGVDPKHFDRSPSPEPTLLGVGRLVARKGFDSTIEALPKIIAAVPNMRYRLVGGGPQRKPLEALAKRLGVETHVDFLEALDDDALEEEYRRAWCFAMPCRRIVDDVEGFGLVYLEAAMAGVPSIGGAGSGADDAIEDGTTGSLVNGTDSNAIADAVIPYLQNVEYANAVGERARLRALQSFTWQKNAEAILIALNSLDR